MFSVLRRNGAISKQIVLMQNLKFCTAIGNSFEDDFAKNYVQTNTFQRAALAIGSAAFSILDPHRGDMIACLAETTGDEAIRHMQQRMQESHEGARILTEKPRINSQTVDLIRLRSLPANTLGKLYSDFLKKNGVTPDSRLPVQFIDDVDLAYVMQRYREVHDLVHAVLQMPTNMLGEVTVKWVEAIQTRMPMCIGGAIFGPIRLKTKHRQLYLHHYLPWAIRTGSSGQFLMNVYFENRWDQSMTDFYREMNISPLEIRKNPTQN